jgi:hypothetical protein
MSSKAVLVFQQCQRRLPVAVLEFQKLRPRSFDVFVSASLGGFLERLCRRVIGAANKRQRTCEPPHHRRVYF